MKKNPYPETIEVYAGFVLKTQERKLQFGDQEIQLRVKAEQGVSYSEIVNAVWVTDIQGAKDLHP